MKRKWMLSLNVATCHGCHMWDVRIIFPRSSRHITSHHMPHFHDITIFFLMFDSHHEQNIQMTHAMKK